MDLRTVTVGISTVQEQSYDAHFCNAIVAAGVMEPFRVKDESSSGNSTVTLLPWLAWVHFLQVMLGSGNLCPLAVAPLVEAPFVTVITNLRIWYLLILQ